jgi:hypothetical protein
MPHCFQFLYKQRFFSQNMPQLLGRLAAAREARRALKGAGMAGEMLLMALSQMLRHVPQAVLKESLKQVGIATGADTVIVVSWQLPTPSITIALGCGLIYESLKKESQHILHLVLVLGRRYR